MKKFISSALTFSMLAAMGVPAAAAQAVTIPSAAPVAADALETRLAAVTKAVKAALQIDDTLSGLEGEAEFSGDVSDNDATPRWDLRWSSHAGSISVTAGEDGKVYSYRFNLSDSENRRFWGLDAAFPKADKGKALAAAQDFVNRLMGGDESVRLKESGYGSTDTLSFTGTLLFHGLPSPVDVRVQLRADNLTVTSFHRGDCYSSTSPEVPSPESKTTSAQAAALLRGTVKLTPYYVLGKDEKTASLRYVREDVKKMAVTADDGRLADLDQVYADLVKDYNENGAVTKNSYSMAADSGSPAAASGGSARLSSTELKTIAGLKDVHTREQLDHTLRALPALGLGDAWTLERASYSQNRDTDVISAQLRYTRPLTAAEREGLDGGYEGELLQVTKFISVDARTNALQSISTTYDYQAEGVRALRDNPQSAGQREAAERFLAAQFPDKWDKCKPYTAGDDGSLLMYAQSVNGYLFPANRLEIRMDADNMIDSLEVSWDGGVTFAGADGIISAEAAADACLKAFDMPLGYIEYPVLENRIIRQKYVLAYAFDYGENRSFQGIDAKTGEPVWENYRENASYSYNDLEGAFGRTQIEALAACGVGIKGDAFQPKAALDQKTMLALLLSACGSEADPGTEEGLDELYSMAYNENLVKASERDPDASVTRIVFLRTLLGASIYGDAAKVPGIYTCPFTDRASLTREDLGYASLAYGLGIARGDDKGQLNPGRTMTRQEAAVMLYNFMMR